MNQSRSPLTGHHVVSIFVNGNAGGIDALDRRLQRPDP